MEEVDLPDEHLEGDTAGVEDADDTSAGPLSNRDILLQIAEQGYWANVLLMRIYDIVAADAYVHDSRGEIARILALHDKGGVVQRNIALDPTVTTEAEDEN